MTLLVHAVRGKLFVLNHDWNFPSILIVKEIIKPRYSVFYTNSSYPPLLTSIMTTTKAECVHTSIVEHLR